MPSACTLSCSLPRAETTRIGVRMPSRRACSVSAQPSRLGSMRSMTIDVGPLEAELLERALAVLDPLDVVAGVPEVRAHRACDDAVVLDEQYACHWTAGCHVAWSRGWAARPERRLGRAQRRAPRGRGESSSVGRAPGCGPGGRGFEPRLSPCIRSATWPTRAPPASKNSEPRPKPTPPRLKSFSVPPKTRDSEAGEIRNALKAVAHAQLAVYFQQSL